MTGASMAAPSLPPPLPPPVAVPPLPPPALPPLPVDDGAPPLPPPSIPPVPVVDVPPVPPPPAELAPHPASHNTQMTVPLRDIFASDASPRTSIRRILIVSAAGAPHWSNDFSRGFTNMSGPSHRATT